MPFNPDLSTFTNAITKLTDADKLAFSEWFFTDSFEVSDITRFHNIQTNVRANDPIPLVDRGEDWEYMKDASGLTSQCDDLPCTTPITNSVKTWSPNPYKCTDEFCSKDLGLEMLTYFNSVKLLDGFDENTFYIDFVKSLIGKRLKASHWAKTYFTATSGVSSAALTGINGIFVQAQAIIGTFTENHVDIAKNNGASYAAQALTPQEGFDIVNAMHEKVEENRKLQSRGDVQIKVTRSIATAYLKWLRENKVVGCCERDPLTGIYTIDKLSIYGTPVTVVEEWGKIIDQVADFNTGTAWVNPHRALATYNANMPIGTAEGSQLSDFDLKYDDYTGKAKFVAEYTFDTKILDDEAVVLAI